MADHDKDHPRDKEDVPGAEQGDDVRPAGTENMKNPPRDWKKEDEESDESFPASDPPANY